MIHGIVNSKLEPTVRLSIRGPEGETAAEAVIDTGFNGALSLPSTLIAELGLRLRTQGLGVLADGTERTFDIYEALVLWNGRLLRVPVGEIENTPLLGTSLLHGSELAIQIIEGGEVAIRELGSS
ncbi:MAG: clan AA aspartic protease [Thermoanaerobaculia bacterium]